VEEVGSSEKMGNHIRNCIGFEVLTVVIMNVAISWDIVPCL
jgi:hypothetical protein